VIGIPSAVIRDIPPQNRRSHAATHPQKSIGAAKQPRTELGFSTMVRHDKPKNSIVQC
jgi:hypothetical protein